jgi:SAM-dependent methyltransferase
MGKELEPYKGISVIYDEIRPSYPEKLIQDIILKTGLKPSHRLLEIGAGTGKATIQFAQKGYSIDAVELGEDMAKILKEKCMFYPKVSVDIASFERWTSKGNEKYDMIYSAQAFHWLDVSVKYRKCAELLKDEGYLVLFWYNPCSDNSAVAIERDQKLEEVISHYDKKPLFTYAHPERREHSGVSTDEEREIEIETSGFFELIKKIEYKAAKKNTAEQYLKVRKSVPAFASLLDRMDEETIEKLEADIKQIINSCGGYINTIFNYSLYISKKIK